MTGRSSQKEVKLFDDGMFPVQIEYAVLGEEGGGRYVGVDYWVSAAKYVSNEKQLRSTYIEFLDDLTKQTLKASFPDSARKKLLDLSSYGMTGVPTEDRYEVGDGYILVSRNRNPNGSVIFAKTQIFADKVLKPE